MKYSVMAMNVEDIIARTALGVMCLCVLVGVAMLLAVAAANFKAAATAVLGIALFLVVSYVVGGFIEVLAE